MAQEYSASMVAKMIGISASTLKSWEKHFPMITPKANAKGAKKYTDAQVETLRTIHTLVKTRGFTLQGAAKELPQRQIFEKERATAIKKLKETQRFLIELKKTIP